MVCIIREIQDARPHRGNIMTHKTKRERKYAATYKFHRVDALNSSIDAGGTEAAGARKAKKKMAESWTHRSSSNVQGFWKPARDRK